MTRPRDAEAGASIPGTRRRGREIGYWGVLVLACVLPFDLEQHPLVWTNVLSITNLSVLFLGVAAWALISITVLVINALRGDPAATAYFSRRRAPLALFLAVVVSSVVSTILARSSLQGLTWLLDLLAGALLWLILPLWLAGNTEAKVNRLGMAIVAGAVSAAAIGLLEVAIGPGFDRHLLLFKFGPDTMGPFLRLSGTFSSANVAAMYFELALPFALAGLGLALRRASHPWLAVTFWSAALDVLLIALMLTYSRGALVGVLAAVLAMATAGRTVWHGRVRKPRRAVAVLAVNLAVLGGVVASSRVSLALPRFTTANDRSWYEASYFGATPSTLGAGGTRIIRVTVENRSPVTWSATHPHSYGVSYHWLHPSWTVVRFANPISWLSADLPPGGRRAVQVRVTAPSVPGHYLLVWDTVWQGTTWFAPRSGIYQVSPVRVVGGQEHVGEPGPAPRLPPPDITQLPTAPALDRQQLWAVAIKMIEQRPAFGEGPQGVRMNYSSFAPSGTATQQRKPPPHAHNLVLEMVADWGLIGGGLFLALLAVLWWPLLQRVVRGRVESGWELAVIGAVAALLGHGLVDYFLNKQSILIGLWLLCGLATTMKRWASL